jgi:hypothetical protein
MSARGESTVLNNNIGRGHVIQGRDIIILYCNTILAKGGEHAEL